MKRPNVLLSSVSAVVLLSVAATTHGTTSVQPEGQRLDPSLLKAVTAKAAPAPQRRDSRVFQREKGLSGSHNYIVRFAEAPLATYRGTIDGLAATAIDPRRNLHAASPNRRDKLDVSSADSIAYLNYLSARQGEYESRISTRLGRAIGVSHRYRTALNGITLHMSQDEAEKIATLPGVVRIERDLAVKPQTDAGPTFIGAPGVWDGSVSGVAGAQGEGMIVGIIDTGINGDHPAFADIGGDGYDHTNPFGSGNYVGECFATPDLLCNDKLIGRYLFIDGQPGTATSSEDEDGHGSHVASTAAGNVLFNVDLPDAEGNDSGFDVGMISGVAPHANIIAYRVCVDTCFFSDIITAVDQAIVDGVDVLNHSIGSSSGSPWESSQAIAFLNARAAGISVANSAGNDGPAAGTAEAAGNAPWVTAVAALSHDRDIPEKSLFGMSGGDTPAPADIVGNAITIGYGPAPIVYAGDYVNGDAEPAQCLVPFPAGTWSGGEIVVCDRGSIARVDKCRNVRDGGAAGCVLANVDGGATNLADDPHVIPAIHIDAADGNALKAWLASGSAHTASIEGSGAWGTDPANGDIMADFSSRGPYTGFDFLAPNVAAPGLAIFAASVAPAEYAFLQGTSMSSPHAAGALALLQQVHPEWTDAEILSALMTTGTQDVVKEDGATVADPFDYGAGRIRVDQASIAGLVLDETVANFEAADPALGGDPASLNVASMLNDNCLGSCSWQRTVEATTAATWTASATGAVTVSPSSFSLAAGETQTITVTADAGGLPSGTWVFEQLTLSPDTAGVPDTTMPVVILPSSGIIPDAIQIAADRDAGSQLISGLESVEITDLQVAVSGLAKADVFAMSLPQDSNNSSSFDDLTDGVAHQIVTVPADAARLVALTLDAESTSPDLDLRVGLDANNDGLPSEDELVCTSGTATAEERCDLSSPAAGDWWVQVQNWTASSPTATDDFNLRIAVVAGDSGNLTVDAPASVPELTPFDMRLLWNDSMQEGDFFFATVTLGSDAANPANIGTIPVDLIRGADDVAFAVDSNTAAVGDTRTFTVSVQPNTSTEDRNYVLEASVPAGFTLVPGSITGGGVDLGGVVQWNLAMPSLAGVEGSYVQSTSVEDPNCLMPNFGQPGSGYVDLEAFGLFPDPGIVGDTIALTAFSGQNLSFYGSPRSGLSFTDDGFAFFDSTPGSSPWANTPIPDSNDPNDLLAMLWRDMEVVYDGTAGSVRGVTLATAGADITFLEYDDMEPWPAGSSSDRIDFQVFLSGVIDNTAGVPEIVFAYDNIVGDASLATIGVENQDGSAGTQTAFNDAVLSNGLMVCYDFQGPSFDPVALSYQVTVDSSAAGTDVVSELSNSVDTVGTVVVLETETVSVTDVPLGFAVEFVGPIQDGSSRPVGSILPIKVRISEDGVVTTDVRAKVELVELATGTTLFSKGMRVRGDTFNRVIPTTGLAPGAYRIDVRVQNGGVFSIEIELI